MHNLYSQIEYIIFKEDLKEIYILNNNYRKKEIINLDKLGYLYNVK